MSFTDWRKHNSISPHQKLSPVHVAGKGLRLCQGYGDQGPCPEETEQDDGGGNGGLFEGRGGAALAPVSR